MIPISGPKLKSMWQSTYRFFLSFKHLWQQSDVPKLEGVAKYFRITRTFFNCRICLRLYNINYTRYIVTVYISTSTIEFFIKKTASVSGFASEFPENLNEIRSCIVCIGMRNVTYSMTNNVENMLSDVFLYPHTIRYPISVILHELLKIDDENVIVIS